MSKLNHHTNDSKKKNDIKLEKLVEWAIKNRIDENKIPRCKKELLSLTSLNLSYLGLTSLPKHIEALKNLESLFIVGNKLTTLPLELFKLEKLEKLWFVENYIREIPKEVNKLTNLKELVFGANYVTKLPDISMLKNLEFIALHDNCFTQEYIKNLNLKNIQYSSGYQKKQLPFYIEPLSPKSLDETEKLRDKIFDDLSDDEKKILKASLDSKQNLNVYLVNGIKSASYWIVRDSKTLKIIGLTGLYEELEDDENGCWLGWFCIDEKYRGKKYGIELLNFSIEKAKEMGKKVLNIYSYNVKKHHSAICMYKNNGFIEYEVKNTKYKRDLYFKKILF